MGKGGDVMNTSYEKKIEESLSLKGRYSKAYEIDFDEGARLELEYMSLRTEILNEINVSDKTIFNPLNLDDIKAEPTEIVCKDFLPLIKGAYNMIAGSGGVGKSTIALRAALHFLRANPNKRAFLVMGEDDSEEIKMRVDTIAKGFLHMSDYDIVEIKKRMDFFTVDNSVSMRFLEINSGTPSLNYGLIKQFSQYIQDQNIEFIVLDPLKKFHSCNENSNSEMDMLVRDVFLEIAGKLKVVMLILHHSSKSKESVGSRGASTLTDTARIAYKISKHYLKNKETGELIEDDSKLGMVKISTIKDNKNIFSKYGFKNTNHGDIQLYPSSIQVEEQEFVMTEDEIKAMRSY